MIVDCWIEDAPSFIEEGLDKEAFDAALLIVGLVRFGKVNWDDAGFDSKLLISIELPNPDSRGDKAAPAPAAPKAAMANAAY